MFISGDEWKTAIWSNYLWAIYRYRLVDKYEWMWCYCDDEGIEVYNI